MLLSGFQASRDRLSTLLYRPQRRMLVQRRMVSRRKSFFVVAIIANIREFYPRTYCTLGTRHVFNLICFQLLLFSTSVIRAMKFMAHFCNCKQDLRNIPCFLQKPYHAAIPLTRQDNHCCHWCWKLRRLCSVGRWTAKNRKYSVGRWMAKNRKYKIEITCGHRNSLLVVLVCWRLLWHDYQWFEWNGNQLLNTWNNFIQTSTGNEEMKESRGGCKVVVLWSAASYHSSVGALRFGLTIPLCRKVLLFIPLMFCMFCCLFNCLPYLRLLLLTIMVWRDPLFLNGSSATKNAHMGLLPGDITVEYRLKDVEDTGIVA